MTAQDPLTLKEKEQIISDRVVTQFLLLCLGPDQLHPSQACRQLQIPYEVMIALKAERPELEMAWRVNRNEARVKALKGRKVVNSIMISEQFVCELFEDARFGQYIVDMVQRAWDKRSSGDPDAIEEADKVIFKLLQQGVLRDTLVKRSAEHIHHEKGNDLEELSTVELLEIVETLQTEMRELQDATEQATLRRKQHALALSEDAKDVEFSVGTRETDRPDPGEPGPGESATD